MAAVTEALLDDLEAETNALDYVLARLSPSQWELPTPATGWAVRDQVSHLAYFDETATLAAVDEEKFRAGAAELMARGGDFADAVAADYRDLRADELIDWFRTARRTMISTLRGLDPAARVPWYGPPMSLASSITARLMETWAHGQDVHDALGLDRTPTARLRHVAHLGVRTFGFSFTVRGMEVPGDAVRVDLAAPDGGTWTWGPADAANRVAGDALDFCLVVTQRRHLTDTALTADGPVAAAWLSVAQAFAGPPGPGRRPATERETG